MPAGNGVSRRTALAGFIAADNLTPQKARILLMMALTGSSETNEIRRMFDTY